MAAKAFLLIELSSSSISVLMVVLVFLECCLFEASVAVAKPQHQCTPSSCGIISNISYPFRLKDHPSTPNCGTLELECDNNNVTSLHLYSHKFYVKEIDYDNFTVRLVDASIDNHDTCSFPNSSAIATLPHPYYLVENWPIHIISCPAPLKMNNISSSYSLFTNITDHHCNYSSGFTYINVAGDMNASDVPEKCEFDLILIAKRSWRSSSNVSLSEIHSSLLYGFQLSFSHFGSPFTAERKFVSVALTVLLLILVLLGAGGSIPIMFGIGFIGLFGILLYPIQWFFGTEIWIPGPLLLLCEVITSTITSTPLPVGIISRFIICPYIVWLLIYKIRTRRLSAFHAIESFLQSDNNLIPIRYSYSEIKKMTRGFKHKHKLGEGGYGSVYKGRLRSGHDVAVKVLGNKSGGNGQDFINEIATIGRIHHVNVVKLVGYCAQGSNRALVFDFMPNGSLEKYLFKRENIATSLNLDIKFKIAVGVARGIEYLHRGCDIQILHFDIKPHNILLDDKFIPKISDFGLAKSCSANKNAVSLTAARGTIGYVAPELISRSIGVVSYKVDVYSFGMVLIEMMNLKRDLVVGNNNNDSSQYFPCWIYEQLNRGNGIGNIIDHINSEEEEEWSWKLGRKMTIVALWCIQMNPDDRPSMNKVVEMLEGDVERLCIPKYPSEGTCSPHLVVNEVETTTSTCEGSCSTESVSLLCQNAHAPNSVAITIQD